MRISRIRLGGVSAPPDIEVALTSNLITTYLGGHSYLVDEFGEFITDENENKIFSDNQTFLVEHDNALTGELLDVALGFLAPLGDVIAGLTGQSIAATLGQLLPVSSIDLLGENSTLSTGNISSILDKVLVGNNVDAQQGSLSINTETGIIGTIINTDSGNLLVTSSVGLSGIEITALTGNLGIELGDDIIRALTGSSISFENGNIKSTLEKSLLGSDLAISLGTIFSVLNTVLNGQSVTLNQGGFSLNIEKSLFGAGIVSGTGIMIFTDSDTNINLVGQSIETSQGILTIEGLRNNQITKIMAMGNSYTIINL